jgi:hypothetical protein
MELTNLIEKLYKERTKLEEIIASLEQLQRSTMIAKRGRVKAKSKSARRCGR